MEAVLTIGAKNLAEYDNDGALVKDFCSCFVLFQKGKKKIANNFF